MVETHPQRPSSLNPLPPSATGITNAVAGRPLLFADRSLDPQALFHQPYREPINSPARTESFLLRPAALMLPAYSSSGEGNSPGRTNSAGLGGPAGSAKQWPSAISGSKIGSLPPHSSECR